MAPGRFAKTGKKNVTATRSSIAVASMRVAQSFPRLARRKRIGEDIHDETRVDIDEHKVVLDKPELKLVWHER